MAFDEVLFPLLISYGSRGGPRFLTDVSRQENANESRVSVWDLSSGTYNARYGVKTIVQLLEVINFFYARNGRARGFRFRDPLDNAAVDQVMVVNGSNQLQLVRNYPSGPVTHIRTIRKPVTGSVTVRRNAAPFASFTLNTVTGILTLSPDATNPIASSVSSSITGVTQANPAVVTTSAANDFIDNDYILIENVGGMVELTDGEYIINQLTTTTFELVGIDSTGFTAYTSGGTALQPGISRSNPARVRSVGHGYTNPEIIFIGGTVVGMTEIQDLFAVITEDGADRFDIAIDSTTFSQYTSGGDAEMHLQPGTDVMDWSGTFDVPVRFDTDSLQASIDAFDIGDIPDIPMVELLND